MKKPEARGSKPVSTIVNTILEDAMRSRADGPSSPLYGARAQLSSTINQAGTLLAKIDRTEPPRRPSLFQKVLGTISEPQTSTRRRSWFFASADAAPALSSKRIELLLKASMKDAPRSVFEAKTPTGKAQSHELHCELPDGATDPVCEPRR